MHAMCGMRASSGDSAVTKPLKHQVLLLPMPARHVAMIIMSCRQPAAQPPLTERQCSHTAAIALQGTAPTGQSR